MASQTASDAQQTGQRAVSPVIGVILMVAITVILAAVIGAFVLEIGDQQETAPSASFDTEERVVVLQSDRAKNVGFAGVSQTMEINTSQVAFTHTGGETLEIGEMEVRVNGYRDAWGVVPTASALDMGDGSVSDSVDVAPQPDFRRGAGTNQPVELSSGEDWNVVAYNVHKDSSAGGSPPNSAKSLYERGTRDLPTPHAKAGQDYIFLQQFDASGSGYQCECPVLYFYADEDTPPGGWGEHYGWGPQVGQGDEANLVWTAESGGKTQTLQQYTAQHTATNDGSWD